MVERKGSEPAPKNVTTLDRKSDREIVITRTFDAPARIVFDAWTRAELVKQWWAPRALGVSIVSCEADVRVGGSYRYVIRPRDREAIGFSGQYTEVTPHTRLVYTQIFEPMAEAGAVVCTIEFKEQRGTTHMTSHELYPSVEALEGTLSSGMEHGMRETLDQLDALVVTLR
jgi:uncharacterized protein YndB with AHSA1/START domain